MSKCFRLPRSARLNDAQAIAALRSQSAVTHGRWLTLRRATNNLGYARLLIRVAKRLKRRAVGRNQIRRCIREGFRVKRVDLLPGDYGISLRMPAGVEVTAQLREELAHLLNLSKK